MKKFVFCAALFAAISFAACSDDDDESNLPVTEANIVGTWQIVHAEGYEDEGDRYGKDTWSEDFPLLDDVSYWWYWTYTFDEGGTGTYTEIDIDGIEKVEYVDQAKFSYSISGNTLTIKGDPNNDGLNVDDGIYQIKSLTKSQLVLFESSDYYDDNVSGYSREETTTYKRIK